MNLSCFLQTQLGRSIAKQLRQSLTTSLLVSQFKKVSYRDS